MVPVSLYRNAVVERRTAIADHVMGFMIAGALAPKMIAGQKSYYKRFEPQPYSMSRYPFNLQVFIGKQFAGGGRNELGKQCEGLQGENYQFQDKADRLYISNKTHEPFTQKMIDDKNDINKYVQDWADQQKEKIRNRGLDDKSQNYAAAYRIMATCPSGMVVWEPPQDEHNAELIANIKNFCRDENHGGVP
jgi:hypothetical protein